MKQYKLSILLTPEDEGGYSVSVPELPGCFTQGETIAEAIDMAKEAICVYVESLEEDSASFSV
jgi:antitoxin HicB